MREAIETMKKKWLVAGFLWGISLFLQDKCGTAYR